MKLWRRRGIVGLLALLLAAKSEIVDPANSENIGEREKRHLNKQQYLVGAIFQNNERNSDAYMAFRTFPNSASLLWQNFRVKERIVHVEDTHDNFQIASAICELVSEGVIAIFTPVYPETLSIVKSMTMQRKVLLFTTSDAHHFGTSDSELSDSTNIIKLRALSAPAVIDFMVHSEWEDILYLYESTESNYRLRWILEKTSRQVPTFTVDFRKLRLAQQGPAGGGGGGGGGGYGLEEHINSKTNTFHRKSILIDLLTPRGNAEVISSIGGLMRERADLHFFILGADVHQINSSNLQFGGINMTALSATNLYSEEMKSFMMEINPRGNDAALNRGNLSYTAALLIDGMKALVQGLKSINEEIYRGELPPISISPEANDPSLPIGAPCQPSISPKFSGKVLFEKLRKIHFAGLTGNVSFNKHGFRNDYTFELWGTKMKQSFSKLGEWSSQTGLHMKSSQSYSNTSVSIDLDRVRIISSILLSPFMMEKKDAQGNVIAGEYEGFCVDVVQKLSEMIKFKYQMRAVADAQFGRIVNGSWDGMVGELLRREADIVVAPLTITSDRERVVDFSTPFMEFGLSVMYQKIEKPTPNPLSFMEPLSTEIWMCISFAYLGVSVVLFLVSRLSPAEWGTLLTPSGPAKHDTTDTDCMAGHQADLQHPGHMENVFSIFNSFWFALSTFVQQGGDIVPRSLSGRIVGGAWWFFTLIIVSSYTANLAAYLTVERMTNPIQSYEDLTRQSKVKYGIIKSGSTRDFFEKSNIKIFQRMWKFMETNPDVLAPSVKEGVERVINSNKDYAFLLESTMNEYFNQRRPCSTVKVGPNLDSGKGYGVATPPGSDLRDKLNLAVLELKEMDWIDRLYRLWWEERGECGKMSKSSEGTSATNSLGLDSVYGLFYLLAGALVIGIVLAVLEFLYRCTVDAKRSNRRFGDVLCQMLQVALLSDRHRRLLPVFFRRCGNAGDHNQDAANTPERCPAVALASTTPHLRPKGQRTGEQNADQKEMATGWRTLGEETGCDKIDYCL